MRGTLLDVTGCEPPIKIIQKEIERNHLEYDMEGIIKYIDGDVIYWVSAHGNHSKFKLSSLGPTLSKIKKQEI